MAKTAKKNGYERIAAVLTKGPKKGLTREQIADRAGLNVNSTGPYLTQLMRDGVATVVGKIQNPKGRPTNLWGAA